MNCPRCGKPLAGGASFCMHCGQPLSPATGQITTGMPAFQQTQPIQPGPAFGTATLSDAVRRRNTLLAVAISLAVLLALFFGLKAAGVLKLGSKSPDQKSLEAQGQAPNLNDLQARGVAPDNSLLQARAKGGPPTLGATRLTMPDNIRNWLAHLEKCELQKRALAKKQSEEVGDMIGDLKGAGGLTVDDVNAWSDPDSNTLPVIEKVASICRELQPAWVDLKTFFDSYPPPPECKPIAEAFDEGLADIPAKMKELDGIVSGLNQGSSQEDAKGARETAREVSRDHRRTIDEPFSHTDRLVQQVCDKYQTRKWFSIDAHGGGSSILGF